MSMSTTEPSPRPPPLLAQPLDNIGYGVWEYRVWGMDYGVSGMGCRGLGIGDWGFGYGISGMGYGVWGMGYGALGLQGLIVINFWLLGMRHSQGHGYV